jgi:hypothetical protein
MVGEVLVIKPFIGSVKVVLVAKKSSVRVTANCQGSRIRYKNGILPWIGSPFFYTTSTYNGQELATRF